MFVGWLLVTAFVTRLWEPAREQTFADAVSRGIEPGLLLAIPFLLGAILLFNWRDVGLNPPRVRRWLRLLWLPILYVAGFAVVAIASGPPPAAVVLIVLANSAMTGVSEELACRGVLYRGLRARLAVWPSVLLSTLLFGAIHLANGFQTGDFGAAATQSVAAFMSGLAFMAIRLRTGSLYPGMVLHGLFDASLFVMILSLSPDAAGDDADGIVGVLMPILFVLPNFLYGLYLLRHAARDDADQAPKAITAMASRKTPTASA